MRKKFWIIVAVMSVIFTLVWWKVDFEVSGDWEGVFLLKGEGRALLEITDDLFPEDVDRYLGGFGLTEFKRVFSNGYCSDSGTCTNFEWNVATGRGFIKTKYPGDKKLLICLSRFRDDENVSPKGLFLGGALPPTDPDADIFDKNESGMAYFDGKRYYHIWCNVNEGIIDESNRLLVPESWQYLGSTVLKNTSTDLTLVSRHRVLVNKVPVVIERYLFYGTGDAYITLATKITNVGKSDTSFTYLYGDEPWIGNYGTSAGDVGWLKDGIVETETLIDAKKQSYAGMFDYGNALAGEKHVYTLQANFIEWQQTNAPSAVFFSNDFGKVGRPADKIPLASHLNRVIALEWGKLILQPEQSFTFKIAVGMAAYDAQLKMPIKPFTGLN
jgi:hypothetical protein